MTLASNIITASHLNTPMHPVSLEVSANRIGAAVAITVIMKVYDYEGDIISACAFHISLRLVFILGES